MVKKNIKISRNPLEIFSYIIVAISIYGQFTTTSIRFITYLLIFSVLAFAFAQHSLNKSLGQFYPIYSIIIAIYILTYGIVVVNNLSALMMRSIILQILLCVLFFVYASLGKKCINRIILFAGISVLVLCVMIITDEALLETLKEVDDLGAYYTYDENNRNTIGVILSVGALYLLHLGFTSNKFFFLLMFAPIVLSLITGSRKAVITVFLGLLIYAFLYSKYCLKKTHNKGHITIFIVVLAAFAFVFACYNNETLYNIIGHRIEGFIGTLTGEGITEASAVIRSEMAEKAIKMFAEKPFLGWGIEGFAKYSGFGAYCHNNYLETLVSFGAFGFIFVYFLKFKLLWNQFKLLKNNQCETINEVATIIFLAVIMVVSLILDMAMVSSTDVVTNLSFALAAASQYIFSHREETRRIAV